MKKVLLGTSALVGAIALFAGAANAEAPKVTLGGSIDFQAGVVGEDSAYDSDRRGYSFQNDTNIRVSVDGKSDAGLGYGAVIELLADVTNQNDTQATNADTTFIYLQGGWGRFELGANVGSSQSMKVDAGTFARATGGISGDWYDFASIPSGATGQVTGYIIRPDLLVEHGQYDNGTRNRTSMIVNKINYYSPRFSGFQVGVSYTPSTSEAGQIQWGAGTPDLQHTAGARDAQDIFSGGLNYKGQFQDIGINLSATGETGEAADVVGAPEKNLTSYAFGGSLAWRGFTFGGSWGTWEDSLELKSASTNRDKDFWDLGLAYDFGPFGASVSYFESNVEDGVGSEHDFHNLVVGVDYTLAPGLVPYAEVSFFDFDQAGTATTSPTADNSGTVFLIGTQLTF